MSLIPTRLDRAAATANRQVMEERLRELQERITASRARPQKIVDRFRAKGKLLPRERVELLLDPGAPFLELSPLAGYGMYHDESPGGSVIAGLGSVSGRACMVIANESTVKGGAFYPATMRKMLRAQTVARENRLPCVMLVESAGANLIYQTELFADQGGRVFANQTRMSADGIPQVALVFGSSTAGGAYLPGMCDYTVLVRGQAAVFLGGPPLVKMATGEVADEESLGGAEMHARVSGVADYLAEDDRDALRIGREILQGLPGSPRAQRARAPQPPAYPADDLLGLVSADPRIPFDMREVIARLVDGSDWLEFKPNYGETLVCGQGFVDGFPLGIIANNGVLFSESANKAAHFIQLCCQAGTPILYLQNITGFMVGTEAERDGIIKHGSKMINAVANACVPQYTILVGGSYGAGNYAMCGRSLDPRFLWSWPGSQVAVMGADQAAGVLAMVGKAAEGEEMRSRFAEESSAYYATARLWDDGILDPRDTRQVLSLVLQLNPPGPSAPRFGTFRM